MRNYCFTKEELHLIESPTLNIPLSKYHINQETDQRLIYGPLLLGGLKFWKLSTEQTILQLQYDIGLSRGNKNNHN